jgi:hypothetical protein
MVRESKRWLILKNKGVVSANGEVYLWQRLDAEVDLEASDLTQDIAFEKEAQYVDFRRLLLDGGDATRFLLLVRQAGVHFM